MNCTAKVIPLRVFQENSFALSFPHILQLGLLRGPFGGNLDVLLSGARCPFRGAIHLVALLATRSKGSNKRVSIACSEQTCAFFVGTIGLSQRGIQNASRPHKYLGFV